MFPFSRERGYFFCACLRKISIEIREREFVVVFVCVFFSFFFWGECKSQWSHNLFPEKGAGVQMIMGPSIA